MRNERIPQKPKVKHPSHKVAKVRHKVKTKTVVTPDKSIKQEGKTDSVHGKKKKLRIKVKKNTKKKS